MKFLVSLLLMLSTTLAQGASLIQEVCFEAEDVCVKIVENDSLLTMMIIRNEDWSKLDPAAQQELFKTGVTFQSVTNERYDYYVAPTITFASAAEQVELIDGMSDAEFDTKMNSLACVASVVGCVGSIATTAGTGGAAFGFAILTCGSAGWVPCVSARRSWIKWKAQQQKKREEARAKQQAAGGDTSSTGGGGGGGAVSGGGQGGWYGPGASVPSGGTVTITEAPPGPMPGAIGGGVGRRPILQ